MNLSTPKCWLTAYYLSILSGALVWAATSCGVVDSGAGGPRSHIYEKGGEPPRVYLEMRQITPASATEVVIQGYRYTHPLSVKWIVDEVMRVGQKRKEHDHKYTMTIKVLAQNGEQVSLPFYLRSAGGPGDTCCLGSGGYIVPPILRDYLNWTLHTLWGNGTPEQKESDTWRNKVAMTFDEMRSGFSPPQPGEVSVAERSRYIRFRIELCQNLLNHGDIDQDARGTVLRYLFNSFLELSDYKSTETYLDEYAELYRGDKRPLDYFPLITREEASGKASREMRFEMLRRQKMWREAERLARDRLRLSIEEWNELAGNPALSTSNKVRMYRSIHLYLPLDIAESLEGQGRHGEALSIYEELQREWRDAKVFNELVAALDQSDPVRQRLPADQHCLADRLARCKLKINAQRKKGEKRTGPANLTTP